MKQHPFAPIVFNNTRILILGSFPSKISIVNNFYYSNPRNQFWKIMSAITNYPINNRDQMIWLLKESKIGLWDMIQSCERDNSLDSSIEDEEVNDIELLLLKYPSITTVAFTGRKSELLFNLNFSHLEVSKVYLPSPSSAFAKMSIEQKIEKYKELLI